MSATPVVVGDRYELGEPLGRGGMATVHRARDRRLDRQVAVKQLSLHLAADTTAQARFRREAQASASLNHPAIASVFDTGEGTDPATGVALPYIVMELVEGSTLRDVLAAGPLAPDRALTVVRSVLDALAHSHAAGLVHRDIKPANVMITTGGAVKVMDFGIARAVDESATSLTGTASVIGTAQYLSPEQALGRPVDLRSDLYSVGCLLFELVTGRPPFVAETSLAIAYQHVREDPVPPSSLEPSLDPALDAVVLRALAKDPDERYPSAAAMREDVDRLLAGAPVAPPPAPSEPPGTVTAVLPPRLAGAAVAA
ncbi:protein kinase domain-containing protein, partial [Microlunatus capsulatus]|uniref:protein kinase domain-containing protein n=1 Tax=Microlunatus capsulatus TaxID=99117 RepID=UPI0031D2F18E